MTQINPTDIETLIELFEASDWDELHLKTDEVELFLSSDPAGLPPSVQAVIAAAPAQTPMASPAAVSSPLTGAATPPAQDAAREGLEPLTAPNLGTFYRSPKPGAPTYVEIGTKVDADTEVCLIEVMKLFTPVRAGISGIVREVCVSDGEMVEYGQTLFYIEPA